MYATFLNHLIKQYVLFFVRSVYTTNASGGIYWYILFFNIVMVYTVFVLLLVGMGLLTLWISEHTTSQEKSEYIRTY